MDWLGNNVKTFKVKGITIIANRNNGMVIGLDREGEEVVDLLKSNLIEISSLSDNQKELYKVLEENDFLKSCYKEIKGIDSVYLHVEYYGAAEPPVRCGESHLSGLTEPPHFVY